MSHKDIPPIDLRWMASTPRQRHFITQLMPALWQGEWIHAAWLSGAYARNHADRWSSVVLNLLVQPERTAGVREWLLTCLNAQIDAGWTCLDGSANAVKGLTHVVDTADTTRGGVHFSLQWTLPDILSEHLIECAPVRLLWVHESLPADVKRQLEHTCTSLAPPPAEVVGAELVQFWEHLSYLPAALNRCDHVAAAHLLYLVRQCLVELVVALNGARRPQAPARVRTFLGPAQLDAFEKTLSAKEVAATTWIGQAVALIVLYHWYAPQLVEMYGVPYPQALARSVLSLLSAEVEGWPALIRTG